MVGVSLRPLWEMVGWVVRYIRPWNPSTELVIFFVCLVSYMIIKGKLNNAYVWPLPYTVSEWPSDDKGWDHWWYLEVGGTARHQGWVAPVHPHSLWPPQSIWEGERNLIGGPTNHKFLPHVNYIVRTCSILFLWHEKLESVSLISKNSSKLFRNTLHFTLHISVRHPHWYMQQMR